MKFTSAVAIGLTVLAVGGCSSTPEVSRDVLEKQLFDKLTTALGYKPQSVTCPGGLTAEKGSKQTCTMKNDGVEYHVVVTATDVKGSNVAFDVNMTGEPISNPATATNGPAISRDDLISAVSEFAQSQRGKAPEKVVCPDELPVRENAQVTCYLHDGKDVFDATVKATKVEGSNVTFQIEIADKAR